MVQTQVIARLVGDAQDSLKETVSKGIILESKRRTHSTRCYSDGDSNARATHLWAWVSLLVLGNQAGGVAQW